VIEFIFEIKGIDKLLIGMDAFPKEDNGPELYIFEAYIEPNVVRLPDIVVLPVVITSPK
jgi:hypothetical protein